MRKKKFFITTSESDLTQKKLVMVCYDDERFAEIFMRDGEIILQLYRPRKSLFFEFPFDEAIEALEKAKKLLINF